MRSGLLLWPQMLQGLLAHCLQGPQQADHLAIAAAKEHQQHIWHSACVSLAISKLHIWCQACMDHVSVWHIEKHRKSPNYLPRKRWLTYKQAYLPQ